MPIPPMLVPPELALLHPVLLMVRSRANCTPVKQVWAEGDSKEAARQNGRETTGEKKLGRQRETGMTLFSDVGWP